MEGDDSTAAPVPAHSRLITRCGFDWQYSPGTLTPRFIPVVSAIGFRVTNCTVVPPVTPVAVEFAKVGRSSARGPVVGIENSTRTSAPSEAASSL